MRALLLGAGVLLMVNPALVDEPPYALRAAGFDKGVLASDERVDVREVADSWLFEPRKDPKSMALVFCPGGLVEPTAYAPLARAVALRGYPVHIIKLAPRYKSVDEQKRDGASKIRAIIAGNPQRRKWVVGGHSLGAAIAALFAHEDAGSLDGLLLCATTHTRDFDLSGFARPVTKVYATRDGVATAEQTMRNKGLLPGRTRWVAVEGGNHGQFGWYGPQPGDGTASIGRERQQEILVEAIVKFLDEVGGAAVKPR